MRDLSSTGSRNPRLTTVERAISISSCCGTTFRHRSRERATRRSPKRLRRARSAAGEKPPAEPPAEPVRIDFEGIEYRILDLPGVGGDLSNLQAAATRAAVLPQRQR